MPPMKMKIPWRMDSHPLPIYFESPFQRDFDWRLWTMVALRVCEHSSKSSSFLSRAQLGGGLVYNLIVHKLSMPSMPPMKMKIPWRMDSHPLPISLESQFQRDFDWCLWTMVALRVCGHSSKSSSFTFPRKRGRRATPSPSCFSHFRLARNLLNMI